MIDWVQLISGFFGSVGFALMFHLRGKKVLWTAIGGGLAWFVYLLIGLIIPSYGVQFLFAGFVLGCYSEIMAILIKMPRTAYIVVGIIPLIPGAALYHTMYYFFEKEVQLSFEYAVEAVVTSAAIAVGLILAMVIWSVYRQVKSGERKSIREVWK